MPGIPLKNPFGGLSRAGSAGPRRVLAILALVAAVAGVVLWAWLRSPHVGTSTTVALAPKPDPLPGGPHTNPEYSGLARGHDQDVAQQAAAAGQSSTAAMPGSESALRPPPPAGPMRADPPSPPRERGAPAPANPPAATERTTVTDQPPPKADPPAAKPAAKPDDNQVKLYGAAISTLLAGWNGKPQETRQWVDTPDPDRAAGGSGSGRGGGASPDAVRAAAMAQPAADARPANGRPSGRVLMPAGRGVYGKTVLAASSDQGGPVVVEALSGPIAGDRMTGGFERREDRLVVRLNSIALPDGRPESIDALLIAPDSMETSVASSVDQHYVSRFVLPTAAAFVAGFGQAIAQSNSTVVAGPFGGATAFQRLNLAQQAGVGAGVAGQQLGALLREAAPKGPTVKLDAGVDVGIVFLSPLVVADR